MHVATFFAVMATFLSVPPPALAMTFVVVESDQYQWIDASGPIEIGDEDKFAEIIRLDDRERVLSVESPGGNLATALALGRSVRANKFSVYLPPSHQCYSACFFVYIAGIHRVVGEAAELGVHQFAGTAIGELPDQAQSKAQHITAELIQFSMEMGVALEALHLGLKTPPTEMYVFSKAELDRYQLLGRAPLVSYGTKYKEGCPFPEEYDLKDPLNLYPSCH